MNPIAALRFEKKTLDSGDSIALITVNRPQRSNFLDFESLEAFHHIVDSVAADSATRGLIITGAGNKAFIGGLEPTMVRDLSPEEAGRLSERGQGLCNAIEALSIPTIAAVNGEAVGGGCEIALSCDLIFVSPNASFLQIEAMVGLTPSFGGTYRLPRRIGVARAKSMILTAAPVDAQRAVHWGLALEQIPTDALVEHCVEVASKMAAFPRSALQGAKEVIMKGVNVSLTESNTMEQQLFRDAYVTGEAPQRLAQLVKMLGLEPLPVG